MFLKINMFQKRRNEEQYIHHPEVIAKIKEENEEMDENRTNLKVMISFNRDKNP